MVPDEEDDELNGVGFAKVVREKIVAIVEIAKIKSSSVAQGPKSRGVC